jgi:uncharacterized membrane protein
MTNDPRPDRPRNRGLHRNVTLALSSAAALLGVMSIVVTLTNGGRESSVGILLGVVLIAMGSMRVWLTLKQDV